MMSKRAMLVTLNKSLFIRFFGEKIQWTRQIKNIRQNQLAEDTGLHGKHISRIERGEQEPSHFTSYKLCRALRVSMDDIHEEIEEKMKQETDNQNNK